MRIPRRKIYRAFPEMDQFTDEQCVCFLRMIRVRRFWIFLASVVAWVLAFIAAVIVFSRIVGPIFNSAGVRRLLDVVMINLPGVGDLYWGDLLFTCLAVFLNVGVPTMLAVLTRDWFLHRALGRHIQGARCPGCKQSLIGLPILEEDEDVPSVRCPECGRLWILRDLGLTPADLRPDAGPVGA